jgi:hypothetical protein
VERVCGRDLQVKPEVRSSINPLRESNVHLFFLKRPTENVCEVCLSDSKEIVTWEKDSRMGLVQAKVMLNL